MFYTWNSQIEVQDIIIMKVIKSLLFTFAIILLSACGGDDSSEGNTSFVACTQCKTFVMAGTAGDGNLLANGRNINSNVTTGVGGADALCMDDFDYPGTGVYKALIVDGINRIASVSPNTGDGQVDWVLQANTNYYRADGTTLVMTTDANGLMVFAVNGGSDLTNPFIPDTFNYWTGLASDWQTSNDTCGTWNNNQNTSVGNMGLGSATTFEAIDSTSNNCDVTRKLLCVEQ